MYDASSDEVSRLTGELSSSFVEVAESNALSQDLENVDDNREAAVNEDDVSEAKAEASSRQVREKKIMINFPLSMIEATT